MSLVGYTNAGKSTLFNALTQANVFAADQLFATLDPTMRRIDLPDTGAVILADTVGFIRDLPHQLVKSFSSTLEEAASANLLIHVIDAASDERDEQIGQVDYVLAEINAAELPCLQVFNKTDLLTTPPRLERDDEGKPIRVWMSAQTGEGMPFLQQALDELLAEEQFNATLHISAHQSRLRALLFDLHAILTEKFNDDGSQTIRVRLPQKDWARFLANEQLNADDLLNHTITSTLSAENRQ